MLLAIDTSTAQVGLALYDGSQTLAEMLWSSNRHHTTQIPPAVQDLLTRSGVEMSQLSAVGVALGPGSFTSLRVGLSLAKGLALARRVPLLGIPTLDIIAAAQPASDQPLIALIQAGRKRIACGEYEFKGGKWETCSGIRGTTLDELLESLTQPTYIAGELSAEDRARLGRKKSAARLAPPSRCARRPSLLAELAWARLQNNDTDSAAALAPIYLHVEGTPIS